MTSSELDVIQSLWLGDFTTMERLAVCSFLENGHEFHLYAYKSLRGVPDGVRLRDANEIVPSDLIYKDSRGTFASFADAFRYKLLLERGGWWVDTDAVCLQPFQAASEHLLALEPDRTIATGVIKAPAGSELIARAWEESQGSARRTSSGERRDPRSWAGSSTKWDSPTSRRTPPSSTRSTGRTGAT